MLSSHSTLVYTKILQLFKGIYEYTKFSDINDYSQSVKAVNPGHYYLNRRSLEITLFG